MFSIYKNIKWNMFILIKTIINFTNILYIYCKILELTIAFIKLVVYNIVKFNNKKEDYINERMLCVFYYL